MPALAQLKRPAVLAAAMLMFVLGAVRGHGAVLPDNPTDGFGDGSAASASTAVSFGRDGLLLSNEDSSTQLRIHGYVQADGRFFSSDLHGQSPTQLLFRRIRPLFEGTLFNSVDFRFMPDFGQNNPQIQELYVELRAPSVARLRMGKFKTPLGLEALRSDRESTFAERSLASDLVPLRELGAQVGGELLGDSFNYAIGYFNGAGDGSNGNFQWRRSNEAVARIFLQPFKGRRMPPLRGLGFGVAGSLANEHGAIPGFKTTGQNTFFRYSSHTLADGRHNRLAPQAYYYEGPVGLIGEYTLSSQEVRSGLTARRLRNQAWQVTASFMLTGEKNSYAGVRPRRAFEPQKGIRHLGGWELAGRYSRLAVDGNAFPLFANPRTAPAAAAAWGLAVNWYLNRFARISNAYEHTSFTMDSAAIAGLHSENLVTSRLQLAF